MAGRFLTSLENLPDIFSSFAVRLLLGVAAAVVLPACNGGGGVGGSGGGDGGGGDGAGGGDGGDGGRGPTSIVFTAPEKLPLPATVGVHYMYSFCKPDRARTSDLCGAFETTTNPTGGQPPYHFVLDSGVGFPPFGISLNLTGLLAGTPPAEGPRTFRVCAVDLIGSQSCQTTSLTVGSDGPSGASVTIQSASCTCIDRFPIDFEDPPQGFCLAWAVAAAGAATGPPLARLIVISNPGVELSPESCPMWTFSFCERRTTDPATTEWSHVFRFAPGTPLGTVEILAKLIDVSAPGSPVLAETNRSVECPD